jgi:ABC-type multidrug transport system ATPase subunit
MLTISNLSKTYDNGVNALNKVDLNIPKGMFGLLGPNGAGKSSLMRTLATLQMPDEGTITFDGIDAISQPNDLRQRLGYLPQDFGVYPRISAVDLLAHLAMLKGFTNAKQRKEVVEALLAKVNLFEHRKNAVSEFSGGMRQRFGIAQALLGDPDLLIVDEPTAGLDPEERNRFHNLLVSLGESKVVILSTHIVDDVAELCPNMAILSSGKILLKGNPLCLIEQVKGNVWKKSVSKEELLEVEQEFAVISQRLFAGQSVVHVLSESQPEGFEATQASLEDLYFSTLSSNRKTA